MYECAFLASSPLLFGTCCAAGVWSAQVIIKAEDVPTDSPAALAMITNKASLELFSHLNQYELEVGQEVGLVANLFDRAAFVVPRTTLIPPRTLARALWASYHPTHTTRTATGGCPPRRCAHRQRGPHHGGELPLGPSGQGDHAR